MMSDLQTEIGTFVTERNWQRFHTPKNLSMAIACEAAELMECFKWDAADVGYGIQGGDRGNPADEVADVMIFCLAFCNILGLDSDAVIRAKIAKNRKRYPV